MWRQGNLRSVCGHGWLRVVLYDQHLCRLDGGVRDARNHIAWRLAGEWIAAPDDGDSDAHLLSAGHPVVTMLAPDLTGDQRPLQPLVERLAGTEPSR